MSAVLLIDNSTHLGIASDATHQVCVEVKCDVEVASVVLLSGSTVDDEVANAVVLQNDTES